MKTKKKELHRIVSAKEILSNINYFHQRVTLAEHLPQNYSSLPWYIKKVILAKEREFIHNLNMALINRIGRN